MRLTGKLKENNISVGDTIIAGEESFIVHNNGNISKFARLIPRHEYQVHGIVDSNTIVILADNGNFYNVHSSSVIKK